MLKRVFTGFFAFIVMLCGVFLFNYFLFSICAGAVLLWLAWEWWSFSADLKIKLKVLFLFFLGGVLALIYILKLYIQGVYLNYLNNIFLLMGFGLALLAVIFVLLPLSKTKFLVRSDSLVLFSFLFLIPTWVALLYLKHTGVWALFSALLIPIVADTGAYFSGYLFGKRKMAPQVSPKKTWEGALGGMLLTGIFSTLLFKFLGNEAQADWLGLFGFFGLSIGLVLLAIFGDLFESLLKRHAEIKDSGSFLPGHGGIFDRLDSLLFVLPTFALLQVLGHFY